MLLRTNFSTSEDRGIIVSNYNPSNKDTSDYDAGNAYFAVHKATGFFAKKNNSNESALMVNDRVRVTNGSVTADLLCGALQIIESGEYGMFANTQGIGFEGSNHGTYLSANNSETSLQLNWSRNRYILATANSSEATVRVSGNDSLGNSYVYLVSN